ncbi:MULTISPECIES: hypothetical protein [Agrobacterium]|uniref:hypothetical protein n=1 Tax=Agrobacterium tumefaciens TaxID=358 RepID=UPI001574E277|nr:hypothetical protein [Agrobacterium tumefaciens]
MCRICIFVTAIATVVSGAHAQERQPFHIARFSDSRTISLAITSSMKPDDRQYDYEVGIGLTEFSASGDKAFTDNGAHAVQVRCETPRAVKVGVSVHLMPVAPGSGDWMQDLWTALCLQPTS